MSAGTSFQGRRKPNGSACHRRIMAGVQDERAAQVFLVLMSTTPRRRRLRSRACPRPWRIAVAESADSRYHHPITLIGPGSGTGTSSVRSGRPKSWTAAAFVVVAIPSLPSAVVRSARPCPAETFGPGIPADSAFHPDQSKNSTAATMRAARSRFAACARRSVARPSGDRARVIVLRSPFPQCLRTAHQRRKIPTSPGTPPGKSMICARSLYPCGSSSLCQNS
jgi:hypothetical protein